MVLWELTLATAYFLGLKRTYRLALKIQRRLISSKHTKIRQFLHGRTRAIFDVALKVHRNIQERDLEMGRSLGNRILRWLDRMKPSANIRGEENPLPPGQNVNTSTSSSTTTTTTTRKQPPTTTTTSNHDHRGQGGIQRFSTQSVHQGSGRTLFSAARPFLSNTQYRQLWTPSYYGGVGFQLQGVIRKDIMLWMHHN